MVDDERNGREPPELVGNLACAPHLYAMQTFLATLREAGWVPSPGSAPHFNQRMNRYEQVMVKRPPARS